jgi:thioredoxin 1
MSTNLTNDNSFDKDVSIPGFTIIVDFWAEWCGPCKQIAPVLEEISNEKKDSIKILKLNIDENPLTPQKYGVKGIPTLMLFKDGNLIDTKVGNLPKTEINNWIDSHL